MCSVSFLLVVGDNAPDKPRLSLEPRPGGLEHPSSFDTRNFASPPFPVRVVPFTPRCNGSCVELQCHYYPRKSDAACFSAGMKACLRTHNPTPAVTRRSTPHQAAASWYMSEGGVKS